MENQENNLVELLKLNNVTKIENLSELSEIYDWQELLEKDTVNLVSEKNHIIIFDTPVFNSCYVIDVLNEFLSKEKFEKEVTIQYCDDLTIYEKLYKEYFKEKFNIEKPIPVILIIANDDIYIVTEIFGPLGLNDFKEIKNIVDGNI
jgi:hypothetical protein